MKSDVFIFVTAAGVPALLIVLGWLTLQGSYLAEWITSSTLSGELNTGWTLIHTGIVIYVLEAIGSFTYGFFKR